MRHLARFLALGAALFAAKLSLLPEPQHEPIRIPSADVQRLRATWAAEMRRLPDGNELAAAVRRHGDEEILLREALRRGLDRRDPVVRSRLLQNMRFVRGADAADADLLAEAHALGMAHRDVVARRRLVQAMEARLARGVEVSDDEVAAYAAAHPDRYGAPARVEFVHVFLSVDRHGAALEAVAARVAARLRAGERVEGDPFLLGNRFAGTHADVARTFGVEFADALAALTPRQWDGPLRSAYGVHIAQIETVTPPAPGLAAAARTQARYALLHEREQQAVLRALAGLRERYALSVEWPIDMARAP